MRVFVALLVGSVLTSTAASGQTFYKCPQKDGSIAYVQNPCGPKAKKVDVVQQSQAEVANSSRALDAIREREYEDGQAKSRAAARWAEYSRQAQESQLVSNNAQLQQQNAALNADRNNAVVNGRKQAVAAQAQAQARDAAAQAQSMVPTFNSSTKQWCTTEGGFTNCH